MAKFDETKVINELHLEKAEVGKKYWFGDRLRMLKSKVERNVTDAVFTLKSINTEDARIFSDGSLAWEFIYPCEEPPKQRMTNRQLAEWSAKGNGQWKWRCSSDSCLNISYSEQTDNREVSEDIRIRSWGSEEWIEPTVDIYLRDCKHLSQDELEDTPYRDGC